MAPAKHNLTPVFIGYLALLVWLPLPNASVYIWSWCLAAVVTFGLMLAWLLTQPQPRALPEALVNARPIMFLWLAWLGWLVLQATPLPAPIVAWLSPQSAFAQGFNDPSWMTLSVDAHTTRLALIKSCFLVALFTLTLLLITDKRKLIILAAVLVASGLFQALYGSLTYLSGAEYDFLGNNRSQATGTFINRNNLAGYLELTIAIGLGLLIAQLDSGTAGNLRRRVIGLIDWILSPKMILRLVLMMMVIALVLTRSRMGNTAFFASMLIAGVIALAMTRQRSRSLTLLLTSLVIIDILIVGAWFGIDKVAERMQQLPEAAQYRTNIAADTREMIADYPLTGSGAGTYFSAFAKYQSPGRGLFWRHAHHDYLQFIAEAGIGVVFLGSAVLLTLYQVLLTLRRRRSQTYKGIAFGVLMAVIAYGIHCTAEFNLQIPANAATFMVLLALGWVARFMPSQSTSAASSETPLGKPWRLVLTTTFAVLVGMAAIKCIASFQLHLVELRISEWSSENIPEEESWAEVKSTLDTASTLDPENADILMTQSRLHLWHLNHLTGRQAWKSARDNALEKINQAIITRPVDGSLWADRAYLQLQLGQGHDGFWQSLTKAAVLAPANHITQREVIRLGMDAWYTLSQEERSFVRKCIDNGLLVQPGKVEALLTDHPRKRAVCFFDASNLERFSEYCQSSRS